ncbi:MAG: putative toxin-antitoxin system toxin component, PIN family [Terracidiphilus sp.]|jgi:putative PIN family toxin of toxin-antitoxin system
MTPRIVLDTNVYISALRYGGNPQLVLDEVLNGKFQLLISIPLEDELKRVLREKFSYSPHQILETTASLWKQAEQVAPKRLLSICQDESDNRVLECALEGKADFVVTGDRHLLNLPVIEELAILTPAAFLIRFGVTGSAQG